MNILCAGAAQGLVKALQGVFLELTGAKVEGYFGAVGAMKEALLAGEPCDVMIVTDAMISSLQADGRLVAGSEAALGRVRTGIAEHLRPRRHTLLELLGKRSERGLIQSERPKAVPRESRCHPALVLIDVVTHRRSGVNLLLDCRHPGAAAGSIAKGQKLVAGRERRGARQQQVLDVVEFEHRDLFLFSDLMASRRSPPRLCIDLPRIAML